MTRTVAILWMCTLGMLWAPPARPAVFDPYASGIQNGETSLTGQGRDHVAAGDRPGMRAIALEPQLSNGRRAGGPTTVPRQSGVVTFPGCDFLVRFPGRTEQRQILLDGYETLMVQNVSAEGGPYLRTECLPGIDPVVAENDYQEILSDTARIAGIDQPEIAITSTAIGKVGTYAGVLERDGIRFRVFGKLVIGKHSLLSLLVVEYLDEFPSTETVFFLQAVEVLQ